MTQMNSEDTFIRKTNYNITDLVGNFVLRTSNQTNASSGYSAIISPVPEPEPPADYEMPQISRQSGRGGLGYNIYDNRLSKYNRRTGPGHYDNVRIYYSEGYLNLGNSKQSNASSGSFASVSPVNQGASQGNPNQLNFTGAAAYVGNFHLRTSSDTNASSGYSAIISPVPEPPIDYVNPISGQFGRDEQGCNYDNFYHHQQGRSSSKPAPYFQRSQRPYRYNGRAGVGHYDNRGCQNLGNSENSYTSSESFASVGSVYQGDSQRNPNQPQIFTGATAFYPDYLQIPHSPSQPPQLPPARRPVHVPVGDQKLKQVLEIDKTFCETSKCCTKKKLCYYIFVIVIFLGISSIVAFSTMNRQKSDEIESLVNAFPEMLQGQDEQITNVNHTVLKTVKTFKNALNSIRFEVHTFQNESNEEMMKTMQALFEGMKTELTEYIDNTLPWGTGQGGQVDGRCKNGTMGECVGDCYNICDGDFQSCNTCTGYITCANRNLYNRPCFGNLVWDDTTKTCEATSNTCNIHVQGTT
ncbi:uncharacterized protein LOC111119580 isoform X2 [Crassostrea virginica]